MLILVAAMSIIGGILIFIYQKKKKKKLFGILKSVCFIIAFLSIFYGSAMNIVITGNDTGYLQDTIVLLTENNKVMEGWKQRIKDQFSDDPQMVINLQEYLTSEINHNNEEIESCIEMQRRVPLYRWLLYFG